MSETHPRANPTLTFTAPGKVEVVEHPVPEPAAREVLIRTRRSLISTGTELTLFAGQGRPGSVWRKISRYPQVPGYSNVGEVVGVGADVDRGWLGGRVGTHSPHAAYVTCDVEQLRRVPDAVGDDAATFTTLAEVAMNGLRRVKLTWGESVAVFGLGILGQLTVRLAEAAGAGPIFGIEISPQRLSRLPESAQVHGLAGAAADELLTRLGDLHPPGQVDVVVEMTAVPELIPEELELLRDQGRFLVLSSPRGETSFDFHDLCNRRSLTIVGAHGFSHPRVATPENPWTGRRHGELFLEWLAAGRLDVEGLISHRFSHERAERAYALLAERRGEAMGIVFEWD